MRYYRTVLAILPFALGGCFLNLGVGKTAAEQTKLVPLEKTKEAIDKTLEASALLQLSSDPCLHMQLNDDGGNHGVILPRVENRVVILEGTIETNWQKKEAERLMRLIPKVRDVVNRLEVIGAKDATEVCEFIGFGQEEEEEEEEEKETATGSGGQLGGTPPPDLPIFPGLGGGK
ncbi:BON domain-containing protein [bacterium]|nr:BON domain-containing protein [bacterium]